MTHQRTRLIRIFALSTAAALAVAACGSSGAAGDKGAANGGAETEFTIELTEFAYKPSDISLPAGETVTLTLKNTGTIPHEFMLGQSVKEDGGYAEDLLAQLDPEVVSGNGYSVEGLEADDSEHAESAGADHAESEGADHAESEGADHAESEGADHAESEGADHADDHGAMIEVEPGGEITLRFTIPADATGTYEMGCFLPGHYDAGMKGTVTVTG